ncbi:MAG: tetratricopeptide repeat protein, partial [Planctomycetota bacterium]
MISARESVRSTAGKTLPESHLYHAVFGFRLGDVLTKLDRSAEAIDVLGPNHPNTRRCPELLAGNYDKIGQPQDAKTRQVSVRSGGDQRS